MPSTVPPLAVRAYSTATAAGIGRGALLEALRRNTSALRPNDFTHRPLATWIGRVPGLESAPLPAPLARWDCRNHRLAWLALNADGVFDAAVRARREHGAERVAVVLGTSTSSIAETEAAYRTLAPDGGFAPEARQVPELHQPHALALFVRSALALQGPALTVSTACSSSAKVFASAERLLRLRLADAVLVGGADSLCGSVLFGFNALQLVSARPCRPFDAARDGISLGEAAGFALLERARPGETAPCLVGYGESSDAHHMSSPHPEGLGAERALDDALARAALGEAEVDYLNLHGTASRKNDEVEAALVQRRFPPALHASATKGLTGHTLGAAGIVEAAVCLLAIEHGFKPGTAGSATPDPACGPQLRLAPAEGQVRVALSHSFGFGGSNCALLFARGVGA